ncbi:aminotransferase class V-fold PLP-dependent enzyme [Paraflavitalea sp. CAU 1676]|uniref:aminotransferase class V-fold PLP-dependent enzyme n=1 Tax=Paraflavitalea sp. CAU 1676 TaxID=3032598 RepID=UPI0023DA6441|nr:aminotransferase class V-fold PLP-dependent enzyme [Paraflavitalea sp. CAU 1676]MDF2187897.1 aminotransferase class V-fold PLP-dependent enzyme [Paraflavitalea sp. CAU 1676]
MQVQPFSNTEIQAFRAATAGTAERIHLNNAGASLPPDIVVDTIVNYLHEEALRGGYETEAKYRAQLDHTHTLIAQLIHADPDEIALVENASGAWEIGFNGIAFQEGDEVITSEMEYVSNVLGLLNAQKQYGIIIKMIPNDAAGNFPLQALEAAITPRTRLIAVTHIPSTAGNILPAAAIGEIARKHGILYLLDACQSAGQIPLDVQAIGCDMLAATGRKYLRGPRGSGFLYVRRNILDKLKLSFFDGRTVTSVDQQDFTVRKDARRFEWYEKNPAIILGLQKAVEYALNIGIERIWQRIQHLSTLLRQRLRELEGVVVHDQGDELCGIVTFSMSGISAAEIRTALAAKNINVNIGFAKSTLYYMNRKGLDGIVRASVHYYNTEEEIELVCRELSTLCLVKTQL